MSDRGRPHGGKVMDKKAKPAAALAVCAMLLSSCGSAGSGGETTASPAESGITVSGITENTQAAETDPAGSETEAPAGDAQAQEPLSKDHTVPAGTTLDTGSMNALELSVYMGNGIDLGNTHEAYGHGSTPWDSDPLVFERLWGQPNTTKEIFEGMKAAGFDTVRIPVAWTNAMNYESGDYTINPAFMERITQVVDYAVESDMFVVLNDHWDGSWWGMFGSADEETRQKAMDMYVSMWTQIGENFKDYPHNLIFESANEELGDRLNDKDVAKDSGSLSKAECYTTTNLINQTFVDTIRGQGSRNSDRFLLIAGYNTDIEHTVNSAYKMPEDTAEGKLFVSVHYYTPADYCLTGSVSHWGNKRQYEEMNSLLAKMKKFTDEGYGVIIGEYGVLTDGSSEPREDSDLWFDNFLNNCDLYDYVPVLWDCNALYSKTACKIQNEDVAEMFLSRSRANEGEDYEQVKKNAEEKMAAALKESENRGVDADVPMPDENTAVAWLMYQSGDWGISYSVGDVYDPTACTEGIKAENPVVTGAGEYTVSLDFTQAGKPKGTQFCALGLANGEKLFPGCVMDIKSVKVNDKDVELTAKPYTTSDDGICTRVNFFNQWVPAAPADGRTADGSTDGISAQVLELSDKVTIQTISVTFELITK